MSAAWHGILLTTKPTPFFYCHTGYYLHSMGSIIFLIVLFFCVLLRCIQKSICVRPVTLLMATGMSCTKNPFAWSVHARATVCMVWAQWYTAHLTGPNGTTIPVDIKSSEAADVSAYDEHIGCITVIDRYFGRITDVRYSIVAVEITVIHTIGV